MKMENVIRAAAECTVVEILYKEGDFVGSNVEVVKVK
jgi:biotin carboxyl carrier protein